MSKSITAHSFENFKQTRPPSARTCLIYRSFSTLQRAAFVFSNKPVSRITTRFHIISNTNNHKTHTYTSVLVVKILPKRGVRSIRDYFIMQRLDVCIFRQNQNHRRKQSGIIVGSEMLKNEVPNLNILQVLGNSNRLRTLKSQSSFIFSSATILPKTFKSQTQGNLSSLHLLLGLYFIQ